MKFEVDLNRCQDHLQCVFAAPSVFAADEGGKLSFRAEADAVYISGELSDDLVEEIETAADMCPVQAIRML